MFFASDNAGPAHPKVMEALITANAGYQGSYGADAQMAQVTQLIRTAFEAPDAAVFLVATGTAANALLLATMTKPWETIFCSDVSHIHEDECNAPEFYTGAKLTLVPTLDGKMNADALRVKLQGEENRGVHGPQRGPVSLTQVTEMGTLYSVAELQALTAVARTHGCKTHMDGARFANALVALGCTPAQMTWQSGVDAVSFGGTKNGLLGVEACVIFDPTLAREFELRRKRGGHLFSKHRFLSAQMLAYLTDELWLTLARASNETASRLSQGLSQYKKAEMLCPPQANMIFARLPPDDHMRLQDAGVVYNLIPSRDLHTNGAMQTARFVTDWSTTTEDVDAFLAVLRA